MPRPCPRGYCRRQEGERPLKVPSVPTGWHNAGLQILPRPEARFAKMAILSRGSKGAGPMGPWRTVGPLAPSEVRKTGGAARQPQRAASRCLGGDMGWRWYPGPGGSSEAPPGTLTHRPDAEDCGALRRAQL